MACHFIPTIKHILCSNPGSLGVGRVVGVVLWGRVGGGVCGPAAADSSSYLNPSFL
jgi:hypothetical protein